MARQLQLQHLPRLGWLVAYYPDDGSVKVSGETAPYIWGDRMIACTIARCARAARIGKHRRKLRQIGVNARLLNGFAVTKDGPTFDGSAIEVRFMDNADR